jgi:hypothetical protein
MLFFVVTFFDNPSRPVELKLDNAFFVRGFHQQAVGVVGVCRACAVVMFFTQHVSSVTVHVRRPSVAGSQYFCYPSCPVADVFPFQPVKTLFARYTTQGVQLKKIFLAAFVDDAAQLQFAVVAKTDVAVVLLPAFQQFALAGISDGLASGVFPITK